MNDTLMEVTSMYSFQFLHNMVNEGTYEVEEVQAILLAPLYLGS